VDGPGGFVPDQARTLFDTGKIAHVPYILGTNGDEGTLFGKTDRASQAVSDAMNAYWARFASTGDPNASSAPAVWPAFASDASDSDKRLQFDSGWEILSDFRKEECAFWRQQYDAAYAN